MERPAAVMTYRRLCDLAPWLMIGALFGGEVSAVGPEAVKKGQQFYLSIPLKYSVYKADAITCGLPPDKVRCGGSGDLIICAYAQSACERAYIADTATMEKIVLFPSEKKCGGFTVAGEWGLVLYSSLEDCQKALRSTGDLVVDPVPGYYGSKMIVRHRTK